MPSPFGNYVLLRRLATGGMGEVFLARPQAPERAHERLVIKRILPHLAEDSEFRDMFLDEARITTQLNHPNLVRIFEVGEVGDAVYLAMEYVHSEDLRSVERAAKHRNVTIPLEAALQITAAAAAGLEHAHGLKDPRGNPLNLVHRDVSPQNILVGFQGQVKLIDFGVAKAVGLGQPTITGVLKGKCAYMSPEQAAGDAMDARSDVFSLGVVFWELLTGRRLFKGSNDQMTMRLVLHCQVPPPSRLTPSLPREVDALVAKVLSKSAADRFPDARSFRLALEQLKPAPRPDASSQLVLGLFPEHAEPLDDSREAEAAADEESDEHIVPSKLHRPLKTLPSMAGALPPEENTQSVTLAPVSRGVSWRVVAGGAAGLLTLAGLLALANALLHWHH